MDSQSASQDLRDSEIELKRVKDQTSRILRDMSNKSQARDDVVSNLASQIVSLKEKERVISSNDSDDNDENEKLAEDLRDVNDSISNLRRNMWNVERELSDRIQTLDSLRSETRVIQTKIDGRNNELVSLLETCPVSEARLREDLGETKLNLRQQRDVLSVRSNSIFLHVMSLNHSLEKQEQNEKLQETTKELSSLETERDEIRSRLRKLREVVAPLREIVAEGSNKNNDSTLDNLRTSVVSVRSLSLSYFIFRLTTHTQHHR